MGAEPSAGDLKRMKALTAGLPSKSAKIRTLSRAGYERSKIARFLDIRYQHVYNVLKQANLGEGAGDAAGQRDVQPRAGWLRIGPAGKIALPVQYLEALGLSEGDEVKVIPGEGELRIVPREAVVARIQKLVAEHLPEGSSLVDELIAERRREA